MTALQADIEDRLAQCEPDVEVLVAELVGATTLRVYIDHPSGVTLELCERVTGHLGDLRDRYRIEVSSPGADRPLSKPAHFRRYLGRRARVRTRPHRDLAGHATERSHNVTGELVGATDDEVTLAAPEGLIAIPYSQISRSNLVEE